MAEGHDWTRPPFAKKVYRVPLRRVFFIVLVAVAIPLLIADVASGLIDVVFTSMQLAGAVLIAALVTVWFNWLTRVDLTPETICTMNDLNLRQTVRLDSIERVFEPRYSFHMFLIVKARNTKMRLWVPLFLRDFDDFKSSLAQVAPPDNPLRAFFEDRGP
ncbi:MAG: hypothetical protein IH945_14100 [Armatimonadetes bacterium]|nr:hypothetical protein [Armatimonadota bacterium]